MKEVVDRASKKRVRIQVIDPVTITTKEHIGWSTSFTSYLIKIETNHWAFSYQHSEVRRRFSEFCWLRSKLQYHHPNKIAPPLPPKRFFHMTKFDPKVIEERCNGLEKFIQRVLRSFVFLSDAALHLFLQSDATIAEIEAKLNEEIKPNNIKRIHTSPAGIVSQVTKPVQFTRSCSSASESSSSDSYSESDRVSTMSSNEYEGKGPEEGQANPPDSLALNTKEFDFSE